MPSGFQEPRAWHASALAGVIAVAGALIRDQHGGVLVVRQSYRDAWALPGGICEFAEPPHRGCEREVREETGLDVRADRLLVVDWYPAAPEYGPGARPSVFFVFDGGTAAAGHGDPAALTSSMTTGSCRRRSSRSCCRRWSCAG